MQQPQAQQAPAQRYVSRVVRGLPTTEGAGVELTRVIGRPALPMLDPFLMLDAFRSDRPDAYLAGFPAHPHRGFETVTYLLNGRMRHKDNAGHEGVIKPGGLQWMTAGRGIVHSEMPEQQDGLLEGFQLWVNLPAANKMDQPRYQENPASEIPLEHRSSGAQVRVISGQTSLGNRGPIEQPLTEPLYLDVELPPDSGFEEMLRPLHNAFVYVVAGTLFGYDHDGEAVQLQRDDLGVLSHGEHVSFDTTAAGARFLLVGGKPLHEPVARGGPFVMNTQAEIRQAFEDFGAGLI